MKIMDTKKKIEKIVNDSELELLDFNIEDYYPCWEVKINRTDDSVAFIFLVDNKEILLRSLSNIDEGLLTIENISKLLGFFKNDNMELVEKELTKWETK